MDLLGYGVREELTADGVAGCGDERRKGATTKSLG